MKALKITTLAFLMVFSLQNCAQTPSDPIPEHETFNITSKVMNEEREINIWYPKEYKTENLKLPVLYMLDGGIDEDFPHVANTLSELIAAKKIPAMILVGIKNTERRRDLSGVTNVEEDKKIAKEVGGSEKFRKFVQDEVFPEISKKYNVTETKSIIGESLAGLFIMETFFTKPDMFDNYIAFDPSVWWNDHYLVKNADTLLKDFPKSEKKLWFAGSGATDINKFTKSLAKSFEKANLPNLKWQYNNEPKEKHATIFRATKEAALIWTFSQK